MSTHETRFVDRLEEELARVAAAAPALRRRRPRAVALVALAAVCLTGGAAVAVEHVLDPDDPTAGFGPETRDRAVVLTGTDRTGRPWQLVTGRAEESFCVSLRIGAVPDPTPTSSGQCGGMTPGTVEATIGGGEGVGQAYGTLPDEAAAVTLTAAGGSREAVVGDEAGLPGKFFVAEIPAGEFDGITLSVKDASGTTIASHDLRALVRASSPF